MSQFDKLLKMSKRSHYRDYCSMLESLSKLTDLGQKKQNLPNDVKLEDGSITCNKSSVFRKWENECKSLYNNLQRYPSSR